MAEKETEKKSTGKADGTEGKAASKKPKKTAKGSSRQGKKSPQAAKKTAKTEEKHPLEEEKTSVGEEEIKETGEQEPEEGRAEEPERELSEDELRQLIEESLEKVTVADIILSMANQLASVGYLKMGIPESVNLKYRDLGQAKLAIDSLEGLIKAAEGKVPEDQIRPFRGTLANLQMNYVQTKNKLG